MKDEIIDEIRKTRKKLDKLLKSDPQKFKDQIKKIEEDQKNRMVIGKPKYKNSIAA